MAWGKRTSLPSYSARCLTESYPHFPSKAPTLPRIQTSQWNHFAYTGLVHCGCLFVGELKKRKYLYYHCTGNRGKCPEPYTRQEVLTGEFVNILQELVIPQPILDWLEDAVVSKNPILLKRRRL